MSKFFNLNHIGSILARRSCFEFPSTSNFGVKRLAICVKVHTSSQLFDVHNLQKANVLVYEAPLKTRIKVVKFLSLSSSLLGFALVPSVIYDLCKINAFIGIAAGSVTSFFLSTPFLLHWITKRYVLELHYNTQSQVFTAKTFNIINQIKEIKFKASDVIVPDIPGMLSSIIVNGNPLFVDANMIKDADAYSHMMGYDKPFDITVKVDDKREDTKTS